MQKRIIHKRSGKIKMNKNYINDIKISSIKKFEQDFGESKINENVAVILISSYDNILEKEFDNARIVKFIFDDITDINDNSFNLFYAKKIHEFIDNTVHNCNELYVCCDSGESRSSAIVAATYRYLKKSDKKVWDDYKFHPNKLVYKLMCDEYNLNCSKLRLEYNYWINKRALKKKINSARKSKK